MPLRTRRTESNEHGVAMTCARCRAGLLVAAGLAGLCIGAGPLDAQPLHPQWSPTGAWIAYYQRSGGSASIYIVRPDGSDRTELTSAPNYDANPTWGPGGHAIAFARGLGGLRETWDIFVLDVGAETETRLTDTPEREAHTSWSPDGRRIAFVQLGVDGSDIFVMNSDGSDVRQLTDTPEREFHPKWSPDSRSLIYDFGGDDVRNVWTLNVETGVARQLTHLTRGQSAAAPAWAPDGTRFSFALREGDGDEGLHVADADGTDIRRVDTGGLASGASFWSPDGDYIAFHSGSDGKYAVYVVPAGGGEVMRISD